MTRPIALRENGMEDTREPGAAQEEQIGRDAPGRIIPRSRLIGTDTRPSEPGHFQEALGWGMESLTRLQTWYANQSDGEWEHGFGVAICTVDNPGWNVIIDLKGTACEAYVIDRLSFERSEDDWLQVWKADGKLQGACGARNLSELLYRLMNILEA